jgi:sulfur-carrier protein
MDVEVRLFANFRDYLPAGNDSFGVKRSLDNPITVDELIQQMGLPEDVPKIIIVNGLHADFDYVVKDGDVVSIFPPLAGG